MATPTITRQAVAPGYLRSARFDRSFVIGLPLIALTTATIVVLRPSLWAAVLLADIWILGYHHVISTYTRLGLGGASDTDHRRLVLLFPATAVVVAMAGYTMGPWILTTTYLYWQWWHYTRQSWGIARVYQRKSESTFAALGEPERLSMAAFYLVPLWGLLSRSAQGPERFLGSQLRVIPVPWTVVHLVGVVAALAVGGQIWYRVHAWRNGRLPVMQTVYLMSHHVIFATGYVVIDSIDHGWLAINIWHNAQYILFVWLFNNKRFQVGDDAAAPAIENSSRSVLASLSQRRNLVWYFVVCFAASTVAYVLIRSTFAAIIAPIVVYQTINFHHYIVDSIIWKVRKKPMQSTLGLAGRP